MAKVRIKVLKTLFHEDLAKEYGHDLSPCPVFREGDEYITTGRFDNDRPEGFCYMAWQALVMPVNVLSGGGKVLGIDEKHVVCCTDGIRPVIFELSRCEEEK